MKSNVFLFISLFLNDFSLLNYSFYLKLEFVFLNFVLDVKVFVFLQLEVESKGSKFAAFYLSQLNIQILTVSYLSFFYEVYILLIFLDLLRHIFGAVIGF